MLGFWMTLSHTGLLRGKPNSCMCNILFILCKYCFVENIYFALHLIWEMWRIDICYWHIWQTIPLRPISFEVFSYFGWLFIRNFTLMDTNLSMIYFTSIFCLFLSESLANLLAIILILYINVLHTSRYLASSIPYIAVLLLSSHSCCNSLSFCAEVYLILILLYNSLKQKPNCFIYYFYSYYYIFYFIVCLNYISSCICHQFLPVMPCE